ncbi:MAG: hypothetical protein HYW25_05590 [Candidatus Aenigmarchaeota archaeon]|nr:hypothetical protein [Candidatus Aenigmarchaeota archaeon]
MRIEAHRRNLKESTMTLRESVERGLMERQRNVGFHTSAGMCDMLEMLLHEKNLIDPGSSIKHEWFSSRKAVDERLPFDFPMKNEIIEMMMRIESKRNILCYGKQQTEEFIQEAIDDFNLLVSKFKEAGLHEI